MYYQDKKTQYERYLQSDEWREKAEVRKRTDSYACQMCGSRDNLQVHHLTYHNIFHEDIEKDLVTLCGDCHRKVHKMMCRITDISTGRRGWKGDIPSYVNHIQI